MNMVLVEAEESISTPNKKSHKDIMLEDYFKTVLEKNFKVSYLIIAGEKVEGNFINKIINSILDAVELDEYPSIKNKNHFSVCWESNEIIVKINNQSSENNNSLWEIVFEGRFATLEEFRTRFLSTLVNRKFIKQKHCLYDEISDEICTVAYPILRELENMLRNYLLRFFTKKFGLKWWDINKTPQLDGKVKERGERTFGSLLDLQLYSIDFIDLTELLDGKVRIENHEVVEAIEFLSNVREDIDKFDRKVEGLNNKLLGNWKKFFEEHITIGNFIAMWKDLYQIRCDVAHNSFMNLTKFTRLVDCYHQIKIQIDRLIEDIKIVKSIEYEILEKILGLSIIISKTDVDTLLKYGSIPLSPQNFSKETLSTSEFDSLFNAVKDELKIFGEYEEEEYQFNLDNEDDTPMPNTQLTSIIKTLVFSSISDEVTNALHVGLKNKKFL
ncbi:HEPN domain-containing protein [Bacillus cereus group sp. BfR-BA-01446]|uniref:HEPN domain-containing protein n=1 Tax=Bacillus cereus group sp. BfR-BA-01446 TaxID=2920350 RepID=UPI001F569603|nr:HEPN domain-containing protein [Bacillus cereus group sp. BfR-BA-01446]